MCATLVNASRTKNDGGGSPLEGYGSKTLNDWEPPRTSFMNLTGFANSANTGKVRWTFRPWLGALRLLALVGRLGSSSQNTLTNSARRQVGPRRPRRGPRRA